MFNRDKKIIDAVIFIVNNFIVNIGGFLDGKSNDSFENERT